MKFIAFILGVFFILTGLAIIPSMIGIIPGIILCFIGYKLITTGLK